MGEERVLPYSEEGERGTLGACLVDGPRMVPLAVRVLGTVTDPWFWPPHKVVWGAMMALTERRAPVDLVTVREELDRTGKLEEAGGARGLEELVDGCVSAENGGYYVDLVRQKAILRSVIGLCREVESEAFRAANGDEHLKGAVERFTGVAGVVQEERGNAEVLGEVARGWREAKEARERGETPRAMGVPIPWRVLNEQLCGWPVGLTLVAARPSAGKSTFEGQAAAFAAMQGIGVARVCLDDPQIDVMSRLLANKAEVSLPKAKGGYAHLNQLAAADDAVRVLGEYPMWVNDKDRDIRSICAWIRTMKLRHNIGMFTIDYVQQISASDMDWRANDNQRVTRVSAALKGLANELGIPGLVCSQLTRKPEQEDRTPILSDLRDSGSLEQDAAVVIFLYQERKVHKLMEERTPGSTVGQRPVWVDVAKFKQGSLGRMATWMWCSYFKFELAGDGRWWPGFEVERKGRKGAEVEEEGGEEAQESGKAGGKEKGFWASARGLFPAEEGKGGEGREREDSE